MQEEKRNRIKITKTPLNVNFVLVSCAVLRKSQFKLKGEKMDLKEFYAGIKAMVEQRIAAKADGVVTKEEKWGMVKTLLLIAKDIIDDDDDALTTTA